MGSIEIVKGGEERFYLQQVVSDNLTVSVVFLSTYPPIQRALSDRLIGLALEFTGTLVQSVSFV